jgi:hypothetical protein
MAMFVTQNSMARGSLAGAKWSWEGHVLTVELPRNGKKELEEAAVAVKRQLQARFGTPVEISFRAGENLEGQALFDAMEKLRGEAMTDLPAVAAAAAVQKQATCC